MKQSYENIEMIAGFLIFEHLQKWTDILLPQDSLCRGETKINRKYISAACLQIEMMEDILNYWQTN